MRVVDATTRFARRRRDETRSRVEQVIAALDHRRIGKGRLRWVAQVLGVHTVGGDLWIQVAKDDDPAEGVVVHCPPWATIDHVIAALGSLRLGDVYPHVVHVMQSA